MDLGFLGSWNNFCLKFLDSVVVINHGLELFIFDTTVSNVVQNSVVEEDAILWHNGNVLSQLFSPHFRNILSVNEDFTLVNFIESVEKTHDG